MCGLGVSYVFFQSSSGACDFKPDDCLSKQDLYFAYHVIAINASMTNIEKGVKQVLFF